ncbi:hypothetical protein M2145_002550 [Lachnospiraceae bacterium PF1-21]
MKIQKKDVKKRKHKFIIKVMIITLLVLSLITGLVFALVHSSKSNSRKDNKIKLQSGQGTIGANNVQYQYSYEGFESLPFVKTKEDENVFKSAFETYVLSSFTYGEFDSVSIQKEVTEKEDGSSVFYCHLNNEKKSVVEGIYSKASNSYIFGWFDDLEVATPEAYEVEGSTPDLNTPDATPVENTVDYSIPLTIVGEESLEVTDEQLNKFHDEMLNYLISNSEFRRALTLQKESIVKSENTLSFRCTFDTQRTDKKNLTVGFDKKSEEFKFIIE